MTTLMNVPIAAIDANPFRRLGDYPFVERKLAALKQSIGDVGLWPGVIARKRGNRYEIAFGHHRVEAARLMKLKTIDLIVDDLADERMLGYMGRENMEDYNADFLVMLETWEAAIGFRKFSGDSEKTNQALEIARLLGWIALNSKSGHPVLNDTARACNAAVKLMKGGHMSRDDLHELTVNQAREIVERVQSRIEQLDRIGKQTKRPPREVEKAKRHVAKAGQVVADQVRKGRVSHDSIRGQVDVQAFRHTRGAPATPLFAVFGKSLADSIEKMLNTDSAADKLAEVVKALGDITLDDDLRIVSRLDFEIGELSERCDTWKKRLTPISKKLKAFPVGGRK